MIRVLIADDHELVRRGVRGLLKEAFPDVVLGEALDAAQTLAAVEKKAWDLVLLDINMPGRNGLDVLAGSQASVSQAAGGDAEHVSGKGLRGAGFQARGRRLRFQRKCVR